MAGRRPRDLIAAGGHALLTDAITVSVNGRGQNEQTAIKLLQLCHMISNWSGRLEYGGEMLTSLPVIE